MGPTQLRAVPATGFAPSRQESKPFFWDLPSSTAPASPHHYNNKFPCSLAGDPLPAPKWCPHRAAGTHQMMHQPLPTLRGDHTQVWLAAVGGELRAMRGWWRRLGRDDLAQAAAIGHGKETWRCPGTDVTISCRNMGDREEGGEGMATVANARW